MGNFFFWDLFFNWVFDRELINIGFGLTGHPSGMPFQKWLRYTIERSLCQVNGYGYGYYWKWIALLSFILTNILTSV